MLRILVELDNMLSRKNTHYFRIQKHIAISKTSGIYHIYYVSEHNEICVIKRTELWETAEALRIASLILMKFQELTKEI